MNDFIQRAIIDAYDEAIAADPTGVKVGEAKASIRDEIKLLVATTDRDLDAETDMLIAATITGERGKRSRSMKRQLEYLLDYFTDPENAITVDALLDTAFSVGDEHGIDKTLRNWTIEDLASVTTTRYRVSAEAVAASKAFDETASEIMRRMRLYGAQTLGQVPWGDSPAGAA